MTKPPPNESSAKSALRRATMPRDLSSGGRRCRVAPMSRIDGPTKSGGDDDGDDGRGRVGEEEALRLDVDQPRPDGREGTERTGERGDGVVVAEEARGIVPTCGAREHRLLQRCERPRLDDFGGERASERCEHEEPDRIRQCEDGSGDCHHREQADVATDAPDPVAVAGKQDGDERRTRYESRDDEADFDAREAEVGQSDTDQDTAESVDERPQRLDEKDAPGVSSERQRPSP